MYPKKENKTWKYNCYNYICTNRG